MAAWPSARPSSKNKRWFTGRRIPNQAQRVNGRLPWLLLYFALAAHLRLGLGRWPDSIGDNPDTPLLGDEGEGRLGGDGLAVSIILSLVAPEVESLHVGLGVFAGVVADVPRGSFPDAGGAIPRAGDDAFAVPAEHG